MYQPLADLLRPTTLDEVVGQEHILGEGAVLRRLIPQEEILTEAVSYLVKKILRRLSASYLLSQNHIVIC